MVFTFDPTKFLINTGQQFQSGMTFFTELGGSSAQVVTPGIERYFRGEIRKQYREFGFRSFRYAAPDFSWQARLDYTKVLLQILAEELASLGGGHIEFGVHPRGLHNVDLPNWLDMVDAEMLWFRDLIADYAADGVTGGWIAGNEQEQTIQSGTATPATSIVRTSNVVTVVWPYEHRAAVNDGYSFSGGFLNNVFLRVASVVNANTCTFTSVGADNTATGTFYCKMSFDAMRRMFLRLTAHWVNDLGVTDLPFSYSCLQGFEAANLYYFTRGWKTAGTFPQVGSTNFTNIDLNIYGLSSDNPETNWVRFKDQVDAAISDLGGKLRITEWNTNHNDNVNPTMNNNLKRRIEMMTRKRDYLTKKGLKHFFFAWTMPAFVGEKFPFYSDTNYGVRPSLYKLIGQKSPFVEVVPDL